MTDKRSIIELKIGDDGDVVIKSILYQKNANKTECVNFADMCRHVGKKDYIVLRNIGNYLGISCSHTSKPVLGKMYSEASFNTVILHSKLKYKMEKTILGELNGNLWEDLISKGLPENRIEYVFQAMGPCRSRCRNFGSICASVDKDIDETAKRIINIMGNTGSLSPGAGKYSSDIQLIFRGKVSKATIKIFDEQIYF
jgi:hypothetical protein